MRKPKITVIGGGTGIPVILKSLREKDVDIAAIVTVADDGGSSGELRKNIQQLTPPGDLRNVLVAMSDMPKFYEKVFQYRFSEDAGAFAGHPLGNIIIAGLSEMQGSTYNAMQLLSLFFHTTGKIYPSSDQPLTLHAVFKDGSEVAGESHIADHPGMIDHVYVTNTLDDETPQASRRVVNTILESDMIVLGPGSLFTSILPNIVIEEIGQALLVNIEKVPREYMDTNRFDEYLVQVEHDFAGLCKQVPRVISSNFLRLENGGAFHDGDLIVDELMRIIQVRK